MMLTKWCPLQMRLVRLPQPKKVLFLPCQLLKKLMYYIILQIMIKGAEVYMNKIGVIEKFPPQFHFSPKANWMNDPNGMVYYAGEYHLFYQYHPFDTIWGPMHWEH